MCPEPEALSAMASGSLASERRAEIADHAASCPACHAALDALLSSRVATAASEADAAALAHTAAGGARAHDLAQAATVDDAGEVRPARATLALAVGDQVDRYVIEAMLGRGGMGVVYRARDPELSRAVAIKVLRRGMVGDRLRREAQALARLSHPNVVAVHDVGTHDGVPFIAMALVDGDTLRSWLRRRRTPAEILAVLCAAGRGLAAAHAVGLIHRDLKPDNVFVARTGEALVGDFGLARGVDSGAVEPASPTPGDALGSDLTRSGMVLGTPAYMAPEQAAGEATMASDQFSFCVTAWEALTGVRPFTGATVSELTEHIRRGVPIEPAGDRRMPARVAAALRRGLSADPARRFPSMTALLAALDAAQPTRRGRSLVVAALAVGVGAAIGAGVLRSRSAERAALPPIACGDEPGQLAATWNLARRAAVERALSSRPGSPSTTHHTLSLLDRYAERWIAGQRAACEAARRAPDRRLYADQAACFERARSELATVAAAMEASSQLASSAATAYAEDMFPVERCANPATVIHLEPPTPAQRAAVDRIRATLTARRITTPTLAREALRELAPLAAEAEALGYRPLIGEIAQRQAVLAYHTDDYVGAEAAARRALAAADELRDDVSRASMAAVLGWILARQGRFEGANEQIAAAEAAWLRADKDPRIEIDILVAKADVSRIANLPGQIADTEAQVARIREVFGPRSIRLATALMELAPMYFGAQRERGVAAAREAAAIWAAQTGSPEQAEMTATGLVDEARAAGDVRAMIDRQTEVIAIVAAARPDSDEEAEAYFQLATFNEQASRWLDAAHAYRAAVAIYDRHPEIDRAMLFDALAGLGRMHVEAGQPEVGLPALLRARALVGRGVPSNPDDLVVLDVGLARAHAGVGAHGAAVALLEPLIEPVRKLSPPRHLRFGLACSTLAAALWVTGGARERERARVLAADAVRAWQRAAQEWGADPLRADQLRALAQKQRALAEWIATHR